MQYIWSGILSEKCLTCKQNLWHPDPIEALCDEVNAFSIGVCICVRDRLAAIDFNDFKYFVWRTQLPFLLNGHITRKLYVYVLVANFFISVT